MNPIISWSLFTLSIATLFFGIISYVNTLNTHSWYIEYDRDEDYILLGFSIGIFLAITFILWKNNFYSRNKYIHLKTITCLPFINRIIVYEICI